MNNIIKEGMNDDESFNNISSIKDENLENTEENFQEITSTPLFFSEQNNHFLCNLCKKNTPLIYFQDKKLETIACSCECSDKIEIYSIPQIINLCSEDNSNFSDIMICQKHGNKFIGYCKKSKKNICEICLSELSQENIIYFDSLQSDINKYINNLKEIFKLVDIKQGNEALDLSFLIGENFIILISMIINDYEQYPNYNLIKNIENIYISLQNLIKDDDDNLDRLDINKIIDIKSKHEFDDLEKLDNKTVMLINSIDISAINFYDISKFCKIKMENLKELNLSDNNIEDIKPLIDAPFINLEILDLKKNKIGDKNIPYIQKFKFEKLKHLNFYFNNFTEYAFFKAIENFKNLDILNVGSNRFKDYNIMNNCKHDLNSIKIIHLINGVFSDETINIIRYFLLNELTEIYLDGNNLSSLEFMKEVKWPNLKRIYLNNNQISSIEPLTEFTQLEYIEIRNNKIIYDSKFEELINNMKQLKDIFISGNEIKKTEN